MKVRLFPVGLLFLAAIATAGCRQYRDSDAAVAAQVPERKTIAVCPTFLDYALQLDAREYAVLPTSSTAESMELLADGTVAFALAGRPLKPQESSFPSTVLGEGYSFLASQEMYVQEADLHTFSFVTDLDPVFLQDAFGISAIRRVEDIYDALEDHIAITSFQHTDYARAAPVHLLRGNGSRVLLSRTPVLYCSGGCSSALQYSLRILLSLPSSSHESS
ncbi:MAG: hypothetical protein PHU04_02680 [Candidatus Peribacteraceae bacterium]|nr:hypothetical protein [Candidatus Peribacteraceae bacterium]